MRQIRTKAFDKPAASMFKEQTAKPHGVALQKAVMSFVTAVIVTYLTLIISLPEISLR